MSIDILTQREIERGIKENKYDIADLEKRVARLEELLKEATDKLRNVRTTHYSPIGMP